MEPFGFKRYLLFKPRGVVASNRKIAGAAVLLKKAIGYTIDWIVGFGEDKLRKVTRVGHLGSKNGLRLMGAL